MTARASTLVASVGLLLAAAVGPSSPAAADSDLPWEFSGPAAGMPATDVPARTIQAASVRVLDGADGDTLHATVTLGAMPDAATGADLQVVSGSPDEGDCRPSWEVTVPTTSATTDDDGDAVVQVVYPVQADDWRAWRCVFVAVTATDGQTVHDRWDGQPGSEVILDSGGRLRIEQARVPAAVRPHRWFPVRLELKNVMSDVTRARVTGDGKGLRVVPTVLGALESGESITTRLWVRLKVDDTRRLRITTDVGGVAFSFPDVETVTVQAR